MTEPPASKPPMSALPPTAARSRLLVTALPAGREAVHAAAQVIHERACPNRGEAAACTRYPGHLQLAEGILHAARTAQPEPAPRRLTELETAVARLIGDTAQLGERVTKLEEAGCQPSAPPPAPKRDPASTTAATTALATPPATSARRREFPGPRAFGFGPGQP